MYKGHLNYDDKRECADRFGKVELPSFTSLVLSARVEKESFYHQLADLLAMGRHILLAT